MHLAARVFCRDVSMVLVSNESCTSDSSLFSLRPGPSSNSYYYSQDRRHLIRIAVVTIMGFLTLLVVTVLLHEAVLADQRVVNSPYPHKLIDKHKLEKVLRGMSTLPPEAYLSLKSAEKTTTEIAPPLPPPQKQSMRKDFEEFRKWREGYKKRRKAFERNGPAPYRLSLLPKDSYDPYEFGESSEKQLPPEKPKYSYPNDAKSIQEIIHFLTESKHRGRLAHQGLRFKGKVKNLDMSDPMQDIFSLESKRETKLGSSNPLEDFRMAGDPKEVNNVLLGFSSGRASHKGSDVKPKTVSLMLDIHPMGSSHHPEEAESVQSPSRSRPRRPPRRNKYPPRKSERDFYKSTRDEMLHARPSYHHENSRPYVSNHPPSPPRGGRGEAYDPQQGKHHQIMLHLNFFPSAKKKQGDVDLNPSASRPAASFGDLAPSPRDVDLRPNKANSHFKAEPIPNILEDQNINVFNRHRYGSSTASPIASGHVLNLEDFNDQVFQEMNHHRLTPVDVVGAVPQPQQATFEFAHPSYPLGGLTYGLPVHRFVSDNSDNPEPRDNTLKF